MNHRIALPLAIALALGVSATSGQEHHHRHGGDETAVEPPRIFLDKSLRVVQYQLKRLDNERLLLVERNTDDPKYAPVYAAILTRAGMSPQYLEEALGALVKLNRSNAVRELLDVLETIDTDDRQQRRTGRQLASLLLRQAGDVLASHSDALKTATESDSGLVRSIGYAGLVVAGKSTAAWSAAQQDESARLDWLAAVSLIPKPELRSSLREQIVEGIHRSQPTKVRRAAIQAIASVPARQAETFQLIVPLVADAKLRPAAVRTLLTIPPEQRDPDASRVLVDLLVKHAEETPVADRTTGNFIDAMQLADQTLARLPIARARSYRQRLRSITVRIVRIHTVEEEMRYDTPFFAVEAGRPVQVILQNEDLMPHNLVVTVPDALQEVAELGLAAGPGGHRGKEYVPASDKVLHATKMVQPGRQERLTFTAPSEPGEYPYVCTFPRHWMRMYGVMIVVDDLDAWLENPTTPKDPIGSNRSFVQAWSMEDFDKDLDAGLRGRTAEIGQRLFSEATCSQCHSVKGQGGSAGPELTDVFKRWKGDRKAVLREILEPSHRIDPKYAVHVILTLKGQVITGIVTAQDRGSVSVFDNPEAPEPAVVQRSDIAQIVKTSKSMMPKALLDRFTRDEIFELLAFLEAAGAASSPASATGTSLPGRADSADSADKRPNFLFILTDDQAPETLSAYGNKVCQTPNIDRLAGQGMVFHDAHHMGAWVGAVCTPSRTMIMTGRTVWNLPRRRGAGPQASRAFREKAAADSLPAVFNRAGYDTFRTCKRGNSFNEANALFTVSKIATSRKGTEEGGSEWHGDQVIEYLQQRAASQDGDPFLIYLGFSHPHDPRNATPKLAAKYGAVNRGDLGSGNPKAPPLQINYLPAHPFHHGHPGLRDEEKVQGVLKRRDEATIRNELGREYGCIENIDTQVGRVLEKLEAIGELDNTYVFFTADHGIAVGRHGLTGKQNLYEHTWRVPFIARGPGIKAGSQTSGYIYLLDVLPTLCDLAGIETPKVVEGKSFRPVLEGRTDRVRDVLYGVYAGGTKPGMRAIKTDGWKLIEYDVLDGQVRQTQLFNLKENPKEFLIEHHSAELVALLKHKPEAGQINLADVPEHAAKRQELEKLLKSEMERLGDPYELSGY